MSTLLYAFGFNPRREALDLVGHAMSDCNDAIDGGVGYSNNDAIHKLFREKLPEPLENARRRFRWDRDQHAGDILELTKALESCPLNGKHYSCLKTLCLISMLFVHENASAIKLAHCLAVCASAYEHAIKIKLGKGLDLEGNFWVRPIRPDEEAKKYLALCFCLSETLRLQSGEYEENPFSSLLAEAKKISDVSVEKLEGIAREAAARASEIAEGLSDTDELAVALKGITSSLSFSGGT